MQEGPITPRNTWLANEAAAITTLHVSELLDTKASDLETCGLSEAEIEELNGMSFDVARELGYPPSLMVANVVGMNLAMQLSDNDLLDEILSKEQRQHFEQHTSMQIPQDIQSEYIGTYFSYVTRLLRAYTLLLDSNQLKLSDYALIVQADFIDEMIDQSLRAAKTFWGTLPYESMADMERAEADLAQAVGVESIYYLTSNTNRYGWPIMAYVPELQQAQSDYLAMSNLQPGNPRSAGCPMRFTRISLTSGPDGTRILTPDQEVAITSGDNPVGRIKADTLHLDRRPLKELSALFADRLAESEFLVPS